MTQINYKKLSYENTSCGLIKSSIETVVGKFIAWQEPIRTKTGQAIELEECKSLDEAMQSLVPYNGEKDSRLFIPTNSEWTLYLDNDPEHTDCFPPMSFLADELNTISMEVHFSDYGAVWSVWQHDDENHKLGYIRSIYNDERESGNNKFHMSGQPYDFENIEIYENPSVKVRFNKDMLLNFLREFGIDLLNHSYLTITEGTPAVLIRFTS